MNRLSKILKAVMTVVRILVAVLLTGTVVCTSLQIITRYVLGNPLSWTEQVTRYLFIWLVGLGIPLSFYEGGSFKFDILIKKLGPKVGFVTDILVWASILGFSSYYFYWSLQLVIKAGHKLSSGIEMPYYFLYGIQPVCAFLLVWITLDDIVKRVQKNKAERLNGKEDK